ncbi:hypothetical protein HS088_TW07G00377 [Tripterygium wilfordii]|uniref:Uncharacterized protein n=1 Tax=Tripterygium wilfordii TaxID=458696 RepID=A0A7J7DEK7_TRIWF|nr:hypothetical protein HS088_TW07G00377 [Tripterygium wilfordii]
MQPNPFPFGSVIGNPFLFFNGGEVSETGFEGSRVFFFLPFLLFQGGDMDLSNVGEKILSSVRSARSLGLLPSSPDRPEVPARAAAAAAIARALAGLPPHQRYSLPSSSEELRSIYGSKPYGQDHVVEELEEEFYKEDFDPVGFILDHIPSGENELEYFEKQAALRLAQLDGVAERLSCHVMEHHQVMVKGMHLVSEVEKDLKVANVICMNGRRPLTSSMNEVSRDLIVNSNSKKKQALLDILSLLTELHHALDKQADLESLVGEGNYCKAFQVLSEYLQLLDSLSELSATQEMSRGVEVWLGRTLQKLDSLLLAVCQEFKGEVKLLKPVWFTPAHTLMEYKNEKVEEESTRIISLADPLRATDSSCIDSHHSVDIAGNGSDEPSSSESPWYQLRRDATAFVSKTLLRGCKNLWQLITSRVSVLLSSTAVGSTSIHQFLKNYEDLNVFILAGEAFCEAVEFRQKLKAVCENYFAAFHRQSVYALKMVLEKESWLTLPPDTIQSISFAGLVGDGAAIIIPSNSNSTTARGICQLFEFFFYYAFETFGLQNTTSSGRSSTDALNYRLRTALARIMQDCDQWIKPQLGPFSSGLPTSLNTPFVRTDERCAGVDTISLVAQILHRSKARLQSMLVQKNSAMVEDFYVHLVDSVQDLAAHIHRTTARLLLDINGYVDRIANAKWEVKELGLEHNGYVDLLFGEFKHYKTRLTHGGINKEVLINGLQHFVPVNVKPKLQIVESFIKEYSKNQIVGLINLVAAMKGWKRKARLEVLEKIE